GGSFVLVLGLVLLPCTYSNALERATWPNLPRLQQTIPAAAPAAPIRPKNLSPIPVAQSHRAICQTDSGSIALSRPRSTWARNWPILLDGLLLIGLGYGVFLLLRRGLMARKRRQAGQPRASAGDSTQQVRKPQASSGKVWFSRDKDDAATGNHATPGPEAVTTGAHLRTLAEPPARDEPQNGHQNDHPGELHAPPHLATLIQPPPDFGHLSDARQTEDEAGGTPPHLATLVQPPPDFGRFGDAARQRPDDSAAETPAHLATRVERPPQSGYFTPSMQGPRTVDDGPAHLRTIVEPPPASPEDTGSTRLPRPTEPLQLVPMSDEPADIVTDPGDAEIEPHQRTLQISPPSTAALQTHEPPATRPVGYLELGTHGSFDITRDTISIGRQADNDLVLDDGSVSRHHARIEFDGDGQFQVHDLDSLNGVFVNGRKVSRKRIKSGDRIELGDFVMRFHIRDGRLPEQQSTLVLGRPPILGQR
ncbi:MAG: FHA domain-containing protein, partial [Gammaproteobacteria bacterium]|nr:FHA domain-containing protein [Gammaproteobacteria bacterium]